MSLRRWFSSQSGSCQFHQDGRPACEATAAYEASIRWGDGHYVRGVCLTHTDALPNVVSWRRLDRSAPKDLIRVLSTPPPAQADMPLGPAALGPAPPAAGRGSRPRPVRPRAPRLHVPKRSIPRPHRPSAGAPDLPRPRLSGPAVFRTGVAFFGASLIFASAVVLMDARTGAVNAGESAGAGPAEVAPP